MATDIMGKSGRDLLAALLDGETDAAVLADLAQALDGRMSAHHCLLIALQLEHIDLLDEQVAHLSA